MPKPEEELKTVMITCYKCGWSFSSRKKECPMCGAHIIISAKELVRILGEYIERQGVYASKKECENFIKKFKKSKKRLPTLDELWKASLEYVKVQLMDNKELKKMKEKKKSKEGQDLDLKAQMEKLKKKKMLEKQKAKEKKLKEKGLSVGVASSDSTAMSASGIQKSSVTEMSPEELKMKRLEELKKKRAAMLADSKVSETDERRKKLIESLTSSTPETSPVTAGAPSASRGSTSTSSDDEGYIICPTCGTKNPPGSKFCMEDGTPLT
ncbi:MAG: zinc-ribbon domain-containing protein [Promethearchaeota archaeon]